LHFVGAPLAVVHIESRRARKEHVDAARCGQHAGGVTTLLAYAGWNPASASIYYTARSGG